MLDYLESALILKVNITENIFLYKEIFWITLLESILNYCIIDISINPKNKICISKHVIDVTYLMR